MDYEYSNSDTFESIAQDFNVPYSQLMTVNNIQPPYPAGYINISDSGILDGYIRIPEIQNGNESVENDGYDVMDETPDEVQNFSSGITDEIGYRSQGKCWININGTSYYFPCFPESYSDSHSAHFTQQTPMGRSEPFQIYQNSGPRVVSVTFKMHVEMNQTTPIRLLVGAIQSAVYPLGQSRSNTIVPKVKLRLANSCYIEGIISDSVTADWGDTILETVDGVPSRNSESYEYSTVTLSFSVTECTGQPKTMDQVRSLLGR